MELSNQIHEILYKMLEPSFVANNFQLKFLLDYIVNIEEDTNNGLNLRLSEDFYLPWLRRFIDRWKPPVSPSIKPRILLFVVDLTINMCRDENIFMKLNYSDVLQDIVELLRSIPEPDSLIDIKLGYVRLMSSLLKHKCGLQWVMVNHRFWFDVFTLMSRWKNCAELREESCVFVVDLLEKSRVENSTLCYNIFEMIVNPLKDLTILNGTCTALQNVDDAAVDSVVLVEKILETVFKKSCDKKNFELSRFLLTKFNLIELFERFEEIDAVNPTYGCLIYKLLTIVWYIELAVHVSEGKPALLYRRASDKLVDNILKLTIKLGGNQYLEMIHTAHIYIDGICHITENNKDVKDFHFQLLVYTMMPLHHYAMQLYGGKHPKGEDDECREQFFTKLMRKINPDTYRIIFRMFKLGLKFDTDTTILALKAILKESDMYDNEIANVATQMLIYHVFDTLTFMRKYPDKIERVNQEVSEAFMETIIGMVKKYDLNWKDNLEVIYVTDIASEILSYDTWSPTAVVKCLELLDVAIARSLSPNMALLIDNATELNYVKIVYNKLHDSNGSIRKAAVKVVETMCEKAKKNFECFRKLLSEKDFPKTIFQMTIRTDESKVEELRCLRQMVEVDEFWDDIFNDYDEYAKISGIATGHADEFTRAEAINLFRQIHNTRPIPDSIRVQIEQTTITSLFNDSNFTVQYAIIDFWKSIIDMELTEHGMVDGSFPEYTFSKKRKKIIYFTEHEIKKILTEVLNELNTTGCLTVFLYALKACCESVQTYAMQQIKPFVALLYEYPPLDCWDSLIINHSDIFLNELTPKDEFLKYIHELNSVETNETENSTREVSIQTVVDQILGQQIETVPSNFIIDMDVICD